MGARGGCRFATLFGSALTVATGLCAISDSAESDMVMAFYSESVHVCRHLKGGATCRIWCIGPWRNGRGVPIHSASDLSGWVGTTIGDKVNEYSLVLFMTCKNILKDLAKGKYASMSVPALKSEIKAVNATRGESNLRAQHATLTGLIARLSLQEQGAALLEIGIRGLRSISIKRLVELGVESIVAKELKAAAGAANLESKALLLLSGVQAQLITRLNEVDPIQPPTLVDLETRIKSLSYTELQKYFNPERSLQGLEHYGVGLADNPLAVWEAYKYVRDELGEGQQSAHAFRAMLRLDLQMNMLRAEGRKKVSVKHALVNRCDPLFFQSLFNAEAPQESVIATMLLAAPRAVSIQTPAGLPLVSAINLGTSDSPYATPMQPQDTATGAAPPPPPTPSQFVHSAPREAAAAGAGAAAQAPAPMETAAAGAEDAPSPPTIAPREAAAAGAGVASPAPAPNDAAAAGAGVTPSPPAPTPRETAAAGAGAAPPPPAPTRPQSADGAPRAAACGGGGGAAESATEPVLDPTTMLEELLHGFSLRTNGPQGSMAIFHTLKFIGRLVIYKLVCSPPASSACPSLLCLR